MDFQDYLTTFCNTYYHTKHIDNGESYKSSSCRQKENKQMVIETTWSIYSK